MLRQPERKQQKLGSSNFFALWVLLLLSVAAWICNTITRRIDKLKINPAPVLRASQNGNVCDRQASGLEGEQKDIVCNRVSCLHTLLISDSYLHTTRVGMDVCLHWQLTSPLKTHSSAHLDKRTTKNTNKQTNKKHHLSSNARFYLHSPKQLSRCF